VYFASTTAPYVERQGAVIIAGALDLREDVATIDFADSLRAGTSALRAARDAVAAGAARQILVVASDRRVAEPESAFEQLYGDGAAAVLVGADGPDAVASIETIVSHADDVTMGWRRAEDRFVRSYNPKHEIDFGYTDVLVRALKAAIDSSGIDPAAARLAVPSPDGRAQLKVARAIGVRPDRVADPLVLAIGVLGTSAPFLALVGALEAAATGESILFAAPGEGADAIVLTAGAGLPQEAWRPARLGDDRRVVASYGDFVRANRLMDLPGPAIHSSPVTVWRDRRQDLNLRGMRCTSCSLVQYPIGRICQRCKAKDEREVIPLSKNGTIFTYTLDHVVASTYSTIPLVRAIIDLEGGARFLSAITDIEPSDAAVGMPVELVFRRMNDGGGFKNYFWKARPTAAAPRSQEGAA
ncbi:MAG: OB-fold domain-containing protein, partial [Actinomycetota bacterium]